MTLQEFTRFFRQKIKVVTGGPTNLTRGTGVLAALDALAAQVTLSTNRQQGLLKAFRYATRAEVADNGNYGESLEDLVYATCCIQTQAKVELYQPADLSKPRIGGQIFVAVFDGSDTPAGYVYVDGSFKDGELVPAKFVAIESQEAKYGYVRRDTSPASIDDWRVGELSIWSISGADQFATAKQAGGPFPAFTGVEDAYWKPAAAPTQPANLLTSDNAFTGTNTFAKQVTVLDLLVSSVQNVALNSFSKLAAFVQGLVPRLGSTTSADPAATTSSVSNVLSRVFGLSDRVDLLARFLIRWDLERRVTLASGGGNPSYVSGNAFVVVATTASSNGNLFSLAAQDYPRQGDLVAVRVRADSIPLVFKGLRFGSPTGSLTLDGMPGQQYIFHACSDVAGDITATYWQVHSTPSSGASYDDTVIKQRLGATTAADPAAPLSAVKNVLSQTLTLADAQSIVAAGTLLPGRTYIVDFGPDANDKSQLVYASALQANLFNRYVTVITGGTVISQAVANFKNGVLAPLSSGGSTVISVDYTTELIYNTATTLTADAAYKSHVFSGNTPFTLTLPAASTCPGKLLAVRVRSTALAVFTVAAQGSDTINGDASFPIWTQESLTLLSTGTGWTKVSSRLRGMSADIALEVGANVTIGPDQYQYQYHLPLSREINPPTPGMHLSGGVINIQRTARYLVAIRGRADFSPGGSFRIEAIIYRNQQVSQDFLASQGSTDGGTVATIAGSMTMALTAGDELAYAIYCGNNSATIWSDSARAPQHVAALLVTEIL